MESQAFANDECIRTDGRSRFVLSSAALAFYRQIVFPCESNDKTYPECGKYWHSFELMQRAQSLPKTSTEVDERTSTDDTCGFGENCGGKETIPPPTKPTNVGGGSGGGSPPAKTSTGKTDSSGKGGSGENGEDDSSAASAEKSKKKKQVGEESYTGESTFCWTEDLGQVAGQPMCDANGSPSCYTKSAQKDSGLPKCGADGKPVASANEGNGRDQAAGGAGDLPQGFPQPPEVESDRALCEQAHKKAFTCCNDPVKCVSGLDGPSASSMTAMGTLLVGATGMIAMGGASGGDSAGIAKSCEFMKIVALGGAGANTALGGKCFSDKGTCEDRCTEVVNKYRRVLTECSNLDTVWSANGGKGPRCPSTWVSDYRAAQANAEGRGTRCTGYNANVAAMGSQAAQSAAASSFADLCQKAAMTQATGFPEVDQQPVFNGDCNDPVNASNPICVNCRGPNAQSDPLCSGLGGGSASTGSGSGSGSSFQNTAFGTRAADGSDLSVPDTNAQAQAPIFGEGLGEEAKAHAIPNNGGGFAGGSGGGGGSMPYSGGGGGYGGPGYETDILKGVGGGGGYSASPLPAESREGYSSISGVLENGKRSDNPFEKFNLQQYLPGGKKSGDPSRNPASANQLKRNPEIGGAHENIFEKISRRYRIMCLQGRLIGCEKRQ
ncbi:MAG: hypothetical protein IPJ71_15625 [Bdellovibrionales bacterium]|nr:hypothetical protein [Bdellovibrionales bacterium]